MKKEYLVAAVVTVGVLLVLRFVGFDLLGTITGMFSSSDSAAS